MELLDTLGALWAAIPLEPGRWVALHRQVPLAAAGALVGAGLLACFFGSGRIAFRLVLAPLAAAAGWWMAPHLAGWLPLAPSTAQLVLAGGLGVLGLLYPPLVLFAGAGGAGALLGVELAGPQDWIAGALPGFLIAGTIALGAQRFLAIVISALAGAASLMLGSLTILSFTRFGGLATRYPAFDLALTACIALGSIVYQLKFLPTDEERDKRRAEKIEARQLAADAKAREKRFKSYDRKRSPRPGR